jgi:hypothetical protein
MDLIAPSILRRVRHRAQSGGQRSTRRGPRSIAVIDQRPTPVPARAHRRPCHVRRCAGGRKQLEETLRSAMGMMPREPIPPARLKAVSFERT